MLRVFNLFYQITMRRLHVFIKPKINIKIHQKAKKKKNPLTQKITFRSGKYLVNWQPETCSEGWQHRHSHYRYLTRNYVKERFISKTRFLLHFYNNVHIYRIEQKYFFIIDFGQDPNFDSLVG